MKMLMMLVSRWCRFRKLSSYARTSRLIWLNARCRSDWVISRVISPITKPERPSVTANMSRRIFVPRRMATTALRCLLGQVVDANTDRRDRQFAGHERRGRCTARQPRVPGAHAIFARKDIVEYDLLSTAGNFHPGLVDCVDGCDWVVMRFAHDLE